MAAMIARLMNVEDDGLHYRSLWMWCPGCDQAHSIRVDDVPGWPPAWGWNGSLNAPTISPSILTWRGDREKPEHRCHSFVENGHWRFLVDCTHALAGKIVPLPSLPAWLEG